MEAWPLAQGIIEEVRWLGHWQPAEEYENEVVREALQMVGAFDPDLLAVVASTALAVRGGAREPAATDTEWTPTRIEELRRRRLNAVAQAAAARDGVLRLAEQAARAQEVCVLHLARLAEMQCQVSRLASGSERAEP